MRLAIALSLALTSTSVMAQSAVEKANTCYKEKNYQCAFDNYLSAYNNNGYNVADKSLILYRMAFSLDKLKRETEAQTYYQNALVANPNNGDVHWALANNAYNKGEYEEALEKFTKTAEIYTSDVDRKKLYYWKGKSYSKLGKYKDALTYYDMSLKIDSANGDYQAARADANYELGKYAEALRGYENSIRYSTEDKKVMAARYYMKGQSHYNLKNYNEALSAYNGAIEYNPENKSAIWGKAGVYYNQSKWPEAAATYTQAMTLYKDDTTNLKSLYYYRGQSYTYNKEYDKGLADMNQILKLDKNYRLAIWQKAYIYYTQKKYKEAGPLYGETMAYYQNDKTNLDDLHFLRGNCFWKLKDTAKAKEDFIKAVSYNSQHPESNILLGHISFKEGRYYEAKDYYNKTIDSYSADSSELSLAYLRSGLANLLTGNNSGVDDIEDAIRYDSSNADAHRYLGEIKLNGKQYTNAIREFDKSIRQYKKANNNDSLFISYLYRGIAYSNIPDYQKSLADYEAADKVKPSQADVITGIGQLSFELKDYQKTINAATKLIGLYKPIQKNELAFAYFMRGRSYQELKNKAKAKLDLAKAIELFPDYAEAKKYLDLANKPD